MYNYNIISKTLVNEYFNHYLKPCATLLTPLSQIISFIIISLIYFIALHMDISYLYYDSVTIFV
jgi:hypothetical protein